MMSRQLRRFGRDASGGVLVVLGLALPLVLGSIAAATEYGLLVKRRQQMQAAVDQAAMVGANQFLLANAEEASVKSFTETNAVKLANAPADRTAVATATAVKSETRVHVSMQETVPTLMGRLLSLPTADLRVQASAKLAGSIRLCLLALDPAAAGALHLEKNAQVTADDCSAYSNSKSAKGLQANSGARLTTRSSCSAGGVDGAKANFAPNPTTDCPQIQDPLRDRPAPSIGSCATLSPLANDGKDKKADDTNTVNQSVTLDPGTYCGGLKITKDAVVTLRPGTYVMKDGPLIVDKKATLSGQNVGFYFTGDRGGLRFDKDTTISLTAPKDGAMAGLLMFEERSVGNPVPPLIDLLDVLNVLPPPPPPGPPTKPLREYRIISDNARTMLGTIYLPAGRLIVDAKKPVADQSAYTVIVAQLVNLYDGPNLVLNARYSQTDIPVPKGVGPTSGTPALTQ